jgi:hypothetical protein
LHAQNKVLHVANPSGSVEHQNYAY